MFAILINASCIAGGAIGLWFGWKLWRTNDAILKISVRPSDRRNGQRPYGSASGIGVVTAHWLAQAGTDVVLADII
ncbi:MAG: hypothetical protein ONB44_24905 [candidate division KSB1 bacterium]|nr:hypothetical protein [candidate division KSB1 bacterium]MDZ7313569.1 hypothetical protein [candidate division KSB1 bacterium]